MRRLSRRSIKKRGGLAFPIIIFLVLNIAFFTIMMLFVQRVSSNALIYEEAYAKKIGLLLNRAESGMEFRINVTDLALVAKKNGLTDQEVKKLLINIDTEKGTVTIKAKKEGSFVFPYFSEIELEQGENPTTWLNLVFDKNNPPKLIAAEYFIRIK